MEKDRDDWILTDEDWDNVEWSNEYFPEMGIMTRSYCEEVFEHTRFENSPRTDCPRCNTEDIHYNMKIISSPKTKWKCKKCRLRFSSRTGTYLGNSKLEDIYWYRLSYLIADLKFPINSHALSRSMGISQKTTHHMLTVVKEAMSLESSGVVDGINYSIPEDANWWIIINALLKLKK